jgi:ATP-dependent Clp protease, protease subunit
MSSLPPAPISPVVLSYIGPIGGMPTTRLRNALLHAINEKRPSITLLIQSNGGGIDEGFALYGLLKSLPVPITAHAIGPIESIANIVFLGAQTRYATEQSHFMFHPFTWTFQANAYEYQFIEGIQRHLAFSRSKFERIIEQNTMLTKQALDQMKAFDEMVIVDAATAKQKGIVQDVKNASIPANAIAYNIDFG